MIPNFDVLWSMVFYIVGMILCAVFAVFASFRVGRGRNEDAAREKADTIAGAIFMYLLIGGVASLAIVSVLSASLVMPITVFGVTFVSMFAAAAYASMSPQMEYGTELKGPASLRTWAVFLMVQACLLAVAVVLLAPSMPKAFFHATDDNTKTVTFYRGDGFTPLEKEVRNQLVGTISVKASGKHDPADDFEYDWVERTINGEVRAVHKSTSKDFISFVVLGDNTDDTPADTWVGDVEVVADLKPDESPYVVHEISFKVDKSYDGKTPICAKYHSVRTKCSVNAKGAGTKATIHIPNGSYNQYVKVS